MKRARPYPGAHKTTKTLADGSRRVFWYAWKGGPRLTGVYGSPEFAASYRDAMAQRVSPVDTTVFASVIDAYLDSRGLRKGRSAAGFHDLAPRTQSDYKRQIEDRIRPAFGDMPLRAIASDRARGIFIAWRDNLVKSVGDRQAEYAFTVLQRLMSFAVDRRAIRENPITKTGRLYDGSRAEIVWSIQDEIRAMDALPPNLGLALQLGIWTGQRPSDVLRIPWDAYNGQTLHVHQSKTKKRITIPVAAPLSSLLDATPRVGPTIVVGERGRTLTKGGFDKMFRTRIREAGVEHVAIGDTRGTAVTRLRASGCTIPEITAITGHSSADVNRILEKHYAASDPELALNAIRKLESRILAIGSPNQTPNQPAALLPPPGKKST